MTLTVNSGAVPISDRTCVVNNLRPMTVVLLKDRSGAFLGPNGWTESSAEALFFPSITAAAAHAAAEGIRPQFLQITSEQFVIGLGCGEATQKAA